MKKYSGFIFLPFLFLLAFTNAGFIASIEKNKITVSKVTKSSDYSNADLSYPNAEIEHADVSTGCQVYPGLQKVPGTFSNGLTTIIFSSFIPLPEIFSGVELFDNNYLSHNYPSHNFW